jgi:hypothetical protein
VLLQKGHYGPRTHVSNAAGITPIDDCDGLPFVKIGLRRSFLGYEQ